MLVGIGVVIIVETAARGGGTVGYLLGPLFMLAGLGRLFLVRRR